MDNERAAGLVWKVERRVGASNLAMTGYFILRKRKLVLIQCPPYTVKLQEQQLKESYDGRSNLRKVMSGRKGGRMVGCSAWELVIYL